MKLLVAERDPKERTGLEWLVRSYPIPFTEVQTAGDFGTLMETLVRQTPSVCCVELDMIPRKHWDAFRRRIRVYSRTVIGITAEATFERAMQAIELHAADLWVKPVSPDRIKRSLNTAYRGVAESSGREKPASISHASPLSYRSLFLEEDRGTGTLLLLQPESPDAIPSLYRFLENYPFQDPPFLFPLSDAVAAVFSRPRPEADHDRFPREGYALIREWLKRHRQSLFIAVCPPGREPPTLRGQYRLARQALPLRFYLGDQQVWTVEEPVRWTEIDPFLTPDEQRLWVEMLEQNDRDGIRAWVQEEFYGLKSPYPDPGLLRIRLTSLLAQLRRFMKSWSLSDDPALESDYHRIFSTVLYHPLLYRIVQEMLLFIYRILEAVGEQSAHRHNDPVERGIRYMEREFHRPELGLEDVAREAGRNPSYFSYLLSQKRQISFRDLLRSIRIRHARRLLETTPLSIQEIAARCGYPRTNTFSRAFKKETGHSPREHRNQKKRE
ncbi:AraC family two component transcriptional regulator [Melghirimyces profundicolus]|uniref:AraC family two component transcriptional regulator n=1 Tax=Melghirimyces profundicolus TaxID=1242148 RepID=A0A2T6BW93_9BACL|nr:helix-turn-helix domain-containing protein [Melghirimyces profundicolus]PTX60348.1 AraC family two component transcriptional regulator [Melghirimyces profundicolus]